MSVTAMLQFKEIFP